MGRLDALAARWPWLRTALDVHERVGETNSGAAASAATLMFFVALFPLLVASIAVLGFVAAGNDDLAADIIDKLGLEGQAAETMTTAVQNAEDSRGAATVIGVVGLLWSGLGVTTAVSLAIRTPWQQKIKGLKTKAVGAVWVLGSAVTLGGALAAGALLNRAPESVPRPVTSVLLLALSVALTVGFFLWTFWALGERRPGWRGLMPGAVGGAVGFMVLNLVGTVVVPRMVASASALYGSLGIVFAILAWLAFFARLTTYASALNAVRYEHAHGFVTLEVKAPRFPDEVPVEADRGGSVVPPTRPDD
jgi:membrane protein